MKKKVFKNFEYIIFASVFLLAILGLFVLYSSSNMYSNKYYDSSTHIFMKQLVFCIAGFIVVLILSKFNYKFITNFSDYFFIICLMLVVITSFAGRISRGSSRWLEFSGLSFQPSEFMKLATILCLAKLLSKQDIISDKKDLPLKVYITAYLPTFLVSLNNLSTGIILFLISTAMIYAISYKRHHFVYFIIIFVMCYIFAEPLANLLYNMGLLREYQATRIFAWKSPEEYPDTAYQTLQSIYAVGSGKIFGRGYLNSIQKAVMPEPHNDMIFSILCEELGIIGAFNFIILYVVLIFRIFYISIKQKDIETSLIVYGIGVHIALQVILNIAVATNLIPNTGVTLPFVSYGGSSLLTLFIEIGILMSICNSMEKKYEEES